MLALQSPFRLSVDFEERNLTQFLLEAALRHGDKPALVDSVTGWSCNYKQFFEYSVLTKQYYASQGIKSGSRVSLVSHNCPQVILTQVAMGLFDDMVLIHQTPDYNEETLTAFLKLADCDTIVTQQEHVQKMEAVAQNLPLCTKVCVLPDQQTILTPQCIENNRSEIPTIADMSSAKGSYYMLFFSSGTTGPAKAFEVPTERYPISIVQNSAAPWWRQYDSNDDNVDQSSERLLVAFAATHIYGTSMSLTALYNGHRIVTVPEFEPASFLAAVQDHKITYTFGTPPLVKFLAENPDVEKYDLSSLHSLTCAAAPLKREVAEKCKKRLKLKDMRQLFGMTEVRNSTWVPYGHENFESIGVPLPKTVIKFVDVESCEQVNQPHKKGEMWVSGPHVGGRYYKNEEATKSGFVMDDGVEWCKTGDIGYFDELGYIYLTEREKDMIKYNGMTIPPADIEAVLSEHPDVEECAVVGKPDEETGEVPAAFVVTKTGNSIPEDELKNAVKEHLPTRYQLEGGVFFLDELPKLASGKLKKRQLRELLDKSDESE